MNKFINIICLTFILSVTFFAQTNTDEYKKNEYYVGYSNQQVGNGNRRTFNGFEGAYVRNINRYFGIKADFSAAYRNNNFEATALGPTDNVFSYRGRINNSLYNVLGGVQIKDNASKKRFKPFAHALAGVGVNRFKVSTLTCTSGTCPDYVTNAPSATFNDRGFALALGGGLDIKINERIDFRVIQVDYNPIFSGGSRQDNIRFGIGFVFK